MKNWIVAFRLRTLPLALSCIGMGTFLAAMVGQFDGLIFSLCITTTIFLQILSNLANDYGDSQHGADSHERQGPSRTVQSGAISKKDMFSAILIFGLLSFVSGIVLIYTAFNGLSRDFYIFLGMGLTAIAAAVMYTMGKRPYGYAGLGDISVMIFFGLVGVCGSYYLFTQQLNNWIILPALSCGCFATGVLNVNNIRDIESDRAAGKKSIPVRIGRKSAVVYHWVLLSVGFTSTGVLVFLNYFSPYQLLFLLSLPLFVFNGIQVAKRKVVQELDPLLKQLALSTLLFVVLFGLGNILAVKYL